MRNVGLPLSTEEPHELCSYIKPPFAMVEGSPWYEDDRNDFRLYIRAPHDNSPLIAGLLR